MYGAGRDSGERQYRATPAEEDGILPAGQPQETGREVLPGPRPAVPVYQEVAETVRPQEPAFGQRGHQEERDDRQLQEQRRHYGQGTATDERPRLPSLAQGRFIPYGVFDPTANLASVFVGVTADTPAFAVESLEKWWRFTGRRTYPEADHLLVLADGGGSNGYRNRAWKFHLQEMCDKHGLTVPVCHYPTGTSKWNPIEHRLFSYISKNWEGRPLDEL